jgi:hypothetical protein
VERVLTGVGRAPLYVECSKCNMQQATGEVTRLQGYIVTTGGKHGFVRSATCNICRGPSFVKSTSEGGHPRIAGIPAKTGKGAHAKDAKGAKGRTETPDRLHRTAGATLLRQKHFGGRGIRESRERAATGVPPGGNSFLRQRGGFFEVLHVTCYKMAFSWEISGFGSGG